MHIRLLPDQHHTNTNSSSSAVAWCSCMAATGASAIAWTIGMLYNLWVKVCLSVMWMSTVSRPDGCPYHSARPGRMVDMTTVCQGGLAWHWNCSTRPCGSSSQEPWKPLWIDKPAGVVRRKLMQRVLVRHDSLETDGVVMPVESMPRQISSARLRASLYAHVNNDSS